MYPNVRAEMARKKITLYILATKLNCTVGTMSLKLNGKAPITLEEATMIKDALNTDLSLEKLFEEES